MSMEQAKDWILRIDAALRELEQTLRQKGVPVVHGSVQGDGGMIIDVDDLKEVLALASGESSLCVLDLSEPSFPLQDDAALRDLDVYLRLGPSNTWAHWSLRAPDDESESDDEDESPGWPFGTARLSIDAATLQKLAMQVAVAPGFGSLRNRSERDDFAQATLAGESGVDLKPFDFWEISKHAETYYNLGVAPAHARRLESDGKKLQEIAREMGISKLRAERALGVTTPAHIAKLL